MHAITTEWIAKAEGDWVTANRELRARRRPNYDAACFHAQQCAEKHLKARLQDAIIPFVGPTTLSVCLPCSFQVSRRGPPSIRRYVG